MQSHRPIGSIPVEMDRLCEKAITQIKESKYDEYLKNDDRHNILIYGIVFCKKKCKVMVERSE